MEPSDETLIVSAGQGDSEALTQLVGRYGECLLGYLVKMCKNREQAEDIFQETFKRVYLKAHTFRGERFRPWLYTIASRLAIDEFRKVRRRGTEVSLNCGDSEGNCGAGEMCVSAIAVKTDGPLDEAVREEQKAYVRRAVAALPDKQRATLVLAYYQGLTYNEVATVLGCSVGTVKTQMYRALKRLGGLLGELKGDGA